MSIWSSYEGGGMLERSTMAQNVGSEGSTPKRSRAPTITIDTTAVYASLLFVVSALFPICRSRTRSIASQESRRPCYEDADDWLKLAKRRGGGDGGGGGGGGRNGGSARTGGRIDWENVTFSYDKRRPALGDLSFECAPTRTAALVGGSVSGESTARRLMLRHFKDTRGIHIDTKEFGLRNSSPIPPVSTVCRNRVCGCRDARYGGPSPPNRFMLADDMLQLPGSYSPILPFRQFGCFPRKHPKLAKLALALSVGSSIGPPLVLAQRAIPEAVLYLTATASIASSAMVPPLRASDSVASVWWIAAYSVWGVAFSTFFVMELIRRPNWLQRRLLLGMVLVSGLNLLGSLSQSASTLDGITIWGPLAITASLCLVPVLIEFMSPRLAAEMAANVSGMM